MLLEYATEISDFSAKWFRMSWADVLWWSKAGAGWIGFPFVCVEFSRSAGLACDQGASPTAVSRLSRRDVYELWMETRAPSHIWPAFFPLCSSTEVETQRLGPAAPRQRPLPGQPDPDGASGHHSVSPPGGQPVLGATDHHVSLSGGRGGSENLKPPQKDSGCCTLRPRRGSKKSHNCTCVMSPSNYCSPSSPWQPSLKTFEGLERSFLGVLCPVLRLRRMLRSSYIIETLSLKTVVSHLTFSFLCVSGSCDFKTRNNSGRDRTLADQAHQSSAVVPAVCVCDC